MEVRRPTYVGLKYFCRHGEEHYRTFYYLLSRVIQHEMDHLNGKLIIDKEKEKMQIPLFKPQTEWIPPETFPDLSNYKEIAIDLETKILT